MFKDRLTKWGFKKNLRTSDAEALARVKIERDAAGKSTEIICNGVRLDFARVEHHLKRKGKSSLLRQAASTNKSAVDLGRQLRIRTPTPPPSLRATDELQSFEEILIGYRTWVDGNISTGVWFVQQGSHHVYHSKPV